MTARNGSAMTTIHPGTQLVAFRCLDDGHVLEEARKPSGPLAARQSTWCPIHDCPAVGLGSTPPGVPDPTGTP